MEFTRIRVLEASFALMRKGITNVIEYNDQRIDFPLESEIITMYMQKWALFSLLWGVAGSMTLH